MPPNSRWDLIRRLRVNYILHCICYQYVRLYRKVNLEILLVNKVSVIVCYWLLVLSGGQAEG